MAQLLFLISILDTKLTIKFEFQSIPGPMCSQQPGGKTNIMCFTIITGHGLWLQVKY